MTDFYQTWPKCTFPDYQLKPFWYWSQILPLLLRSRLLMWRRSNSFRACHMLIDMMQFVWSSNKLKTWTQVIQFSKHCQFCVWSLVEANNRSNNCLTGLSFLLALRRERFSLNYFSLPSFLVHNVDSFCHKVSASNIKNYKTYHFWCEFTGFFFLFY